MGLPEIIALDKWNLSSINDCYKEIKLLCSKKKKKTSFHLLCVCRPLVATVSLCFITA